MCLCVCGGRHLKQKRSEIERYRCVRLAFAVCLRRLGRSDLAGDAASAARARRWPSFHSHLDDTSHSTFDDPMKLPLLRRTRPPGPPSATSCGDPAVIGPRIRKNAVLRDSPNIFARLQPRPSCLLPFPTPLVLEAAARKRQDDENRNIVHRPNDEEGPSRNCGRVGRRISFALHLGGHQPISPDFCTWPVSTNFGQS